MDEGWELYEEDRGLATQALAAVLELFTPAQVGMFMIAMRSRNYDLAVTMIATVMRAALELLADDYE